MDGTLGTRAARLRMLAMYMKACLVVLFDLRDGVEVRGLCNMLTMSAVAACLR